MDITSFMQTPLFNWVLMPLLIIISRLFDVTLSTIRVVFTARGEKRLAAITAFFEVLLWLIIIRQIFSDVTNPLWFIAYAFGFSLGTYLGMSISEKLAVGKVMIRIVTKKDASELIAHLRKEKYGVTSVTAEGKDNLNKIIFSVVGNKDVPHILDIIKKHNPKAFYTVEDVRKANKGQFRPGRAVPFTSPLAMLAKMKRK